MPTKRKVADGKIVKNEIVPKTKELSMQDHNANMCCLSGQLLENPVFIKDEPRYNYSRTFIEQWFDFCTKQLKTVISPVTGNEIRPCLVNNKDIDNDVLLALQERAKKEVETSSIMALREVFSIIDPLRDSISEALTDWQPPQIVVLGQESTGKSTVLERLIMMSLFPRDENICTRMPIHVRLRNTSEAKAPTLEVYNKSTRCTEEGPVMLSVELGSRDISKKMDEILKKETGNSQLVSLERILIVRVEGPLFPSVDIIDLPGLVSFPQELEERTRALAESHISEHGAYSLFLLVVPAGEVPRNSNAMKLVEKHRLADRTLGVFTMCDEVPTRKLAALRKCIFAGAAPGEAQDLVVDSELDGAAGLNGWVATANKPIAGQDTQMERLRVQAEEEQKVLEERLPGAQAAGRAGCGALVHRLNDFYLDNVRTTWAPDTLARLAASERDARKQSADLGLPPFLGENMDPAAARVSAAAEAGRILRESWPKLVCSEILNQFREQLLAALRNGGESIAAGTLAVVEAKEQDNLSSVVMDYVGKVVEWCADSALHQLRTEQACSRPGVFRLVRFPKFLQEADARLRAGLLSRRKGLSHTVTALVSYLYQPTSHWVKIRVNLGSSPPSVFRQVDCEAFSDAIIASFIRWVGSLENTLLESVHEAASQVKVWEEACATDRRRIESFLERIHDTRRELLKLLAVQRTGSIPTDIGSINCMCWNRDGQAILIGAEQGSVECWDARRFVRTARWSTGASVLNLSYCPTRPVVAVAGSDLVVRLFQGTSGSMESSMRIGSSPQLAWSPDGRLLAAACTDGSVYLLAGGQGRGLNHEARFDGHSSGSLAVAFSPCGGILVSGDSQGVLRIWDIESRMLVRTWDDSKERVASLSWATDASTIYVLSSDGKIGAREAQCGKFICRPLAATGRNLASAGEGRVSLSANGVLLAVACGPSVAVLDADLKQVGKLEGAKEESLVSVAFSPSGRTLASIGRDGVRVWAAPESDAAANSAARRGGVLAPQGR